MATITDARVFLILMGARKIGSALYSWGGESETEGGYDCSGFVSHILTEANRAWPGIYTGGRQTAKGIYKHYDKLGCPDITKVRDLRPGCVVVYFDRGKRPARSATHVAVHIADVPDMHFAHGNSVITSDVGPVAFEAGGSGSAAKTPRNALKKSATIRVTATDVHGGQAWVAKDPFFHLQRILSGAVSIDIEEATGGPNIIDKLAAETGIAIGELLKAQASVNFVIVTKYNRAREIAGTWRAGKLPSPISRYPSDSGELAILVAHYQRSHGFRRSDIDGKLGPVTWAHLQGQA